MTAHLPVISARDAVRAFAKLGYMQLPKRGKGSHIVMARDGSPAILTIPNERELKRGLLRALIRQTGLSVEEFRALL